MAYTIYPRLLNLAALLTKKSFFFFGPRGTGKSRLIEKTLRNAQVYDLLHAPTFSRLSRRPTLIGEELTAKNSLVVIDEVQKLPSLLDEVHRLIEKKGIRFLLTGSSARKLKRGAVNLLAGRAWETRLFPLVSAELKSFDLQRLLLIGGLPAVWNSSEPWEELKAYTGTYLKEEIVAEALVRRLDNFVRFLDVAVTKVGEEINFASLSSDCGVGARTVQNFFELLEDTLLGFCLPPFRLTVQRKAVSRSKFYLFDLGVASSLLERQELSPGSEAFGRAFEHFLILELRAYLSYFRRDEKLCFWRSQSGFEVDCVVGKKLAIEVRATDLVNERQLKGLRAFREEGLVKGYCVVSRDPQERTVDGIRIYPWEIFLNKLWSGSLF